MSKKIKWPDDKKANKLIYSLIKKQVTKTIQTPFLTVRTFDIPTVGQWQSF